MSDIKIIGEEIDAKCRAETYFNTVYSSPDNVIDIELAIRTTYEKAFLEGRKFERESGNVTRGLYNPLEMRKAFEEGKQLQVKTTNGWIDITTRCETSSNAIDWDSHVFRIKPNGYRPFKDCNELIAYWYKKLDAKTEYKIVKDDLRIPCIWVTNRDNGCREMILGFGVSAVLLPRVAKDMNELFEQYTFLDGSICGVEE